MQTKECHSQQTVEQKLAIWILSLMQNFVGAEETGQRAEVRLDPGFQVTQNVMFTVTLTVDLIVRIARVLAQNQFDRSIGRFIASTFPHHSSRSASRAGL